MNNAEQYLIENNINPSYQRVKIMDYLLNNRDHPTIDMIFLYLKPTMPKLSKTTVYNTLQHFVEKGITQIINIEDNEIRYDIDTSAHGHFKCTSCGKIYDFPYNINDITICGLDNFSIHQTHIYIKGICEKCNKKLKA